MSKLFEKLKIREIEFRNRLWISPMCQYSSIDGMPTDWHLVHLGSRAVGGAGLVIMEATAVTPEGRISPEDMGIWSDDHTKAFKRITKFIKDNGSVAGIQLAHAGRKASTFAPWNGNGEVPLANGGWQVIGPSAIKFADHYADPREMSEQDCVDVIDQFTAAAKRAVEAGFEVIEVHAAHGYLLHEFLSPFSNQRTDKYGGSLEGRMRFPLEIAKCVRDVVPQNLPVFVRISATDWTTGGWDETQSVEFAKELKNIGIDLIDVSTGGNLPRAVIPNKPGYQVEFAEKIKREADILTAAVGLITNAKQADEIVLSGKADAVLIARQSLRDPYFAINAAIELGESIDIPDQYSRGIVIAEKVGA